MIGFRGSFSTAHGMIDGVLNHGADTAFASEPACFAGFAERDVLVVTVTNGADGGGALQQELTKFAAGHTNESKLAFSGHQLSADAGGPYQLGSASRLKLDVVNQRAVGNVAEFLGVAGADIRIGTGNNGVAHVELIGANDVAFCGRNCCGRPFSFCDRQAESARASVL